MEITGSPHRLATGLRVAARRTDSPVEYLGVAVNVGSRDDGPGRHGLAHFIEHCLFKGTPTHSATAILNALERVGGELNAYTTKEETMVYAIVPAGNMRRATALIADIVENSHFPDQELDREREVVGDEIDSYLDVPADAILDDFEEYLFPGDPALGHNILGSRRELEGFDSAVCRDFLTRNYTAGQMVYFYSGPMDPEKVVRVAERCFSTLTRPDTPRRRGARWQDVGAFTRSDAKDSHQSHTVTGMATPGMMDPRRHALALLTNVIGGPGMNSRLNLALRERRGLVYTVEAGLSLMSDIGIFTVYYGCDPGDAARCLRLTRGALARISREGLSPAALAAAKRQYEGQFIVATANGEQSALSLGRHVLYHDTMPSIEKTIDNIRAITADDVRRVAALFGPERLSTLTFQ